MLVKGCSAREAARRVGFSNRTVSTWASLAGMQLKTKTETGGLEGPRPPAAQSLRLVLAQWVLIGLRLDARWSRRAIARTLGVAALTVSREVTLGTRYGRYDPGWSQCQAERL